MSDEMVTVYEMRDGGIGNSVEMSPGDAAKACEAKTHWSGFSGGKIPDAWSGKTSAKKSNNVASDAGEK